MSPRVAVDEVGGGDVIAHAAGRRVARRGLAVTLTGDDGVTGEGEASPLPGYSPEPLSLVREELRSGTPRSGSARFALESAEVDLAGKRAGLSAARVLGGDAAQRAVPCVTVVVSEDPAALDAALRSGARALKLKLGPDARAAGRWLLAARRQVGDGVELRADANGAYDLDDARALLAVAADAGVSFVEEPTRGLGLLALLGAGAPIAIDESLALPGLREAALASPAVSVFVLKPAMFGLLNSRAMALEAHAAGKRVVVTHLFDGPVALAAAAAVALSLPFAPLACGLAPHDGLLAYPRRRIAGLGRHLVEDVGAPGLGLDAP